MTSPDLKLARRAILQSANPTLVRVSEKNHSRIAAAKNIRLELAAAFPGVKFSVKGRTASMMDAIDVRWTDGPMSAQVDAIIDKYAAGSFSGSDDLYTYSSSDWTACFGDAKYVSSHRDYSDEAVAAALRRVQAKYGADLAEARVSLPTVDIWKKGRVISYFVGNNDLRSLINVALYKHTAFARPARVLAVWPDFEEVEVAA